MNNKTIIKIILTCLIIFGSFFLIRHLLPESENEENGTITVRIINEYDVIIKEKQIDFTEEDNLPDLLKANFNNVRFMSFGFGLALVEIEELVSDFTGNSFIRILINNDPAQSNVGISAISLRDQMIIAFILEKS
ncbi:MAG: hypothetical protein FWE36_05980 [Erysipelotrichales bacterium]|nr:hypothetical protein [Erysipelotrichales bacterium]